MLNVMRQHTDFYKIPESILPAHSLQCVLCPCLKISVPTSHVWDLSLSSYFHMLLFHNLTYPWIPANAFPSEFCIFVGWITISLSVLDDEYYCLLSLALLYLVSVGPFPCDLNN